MIIKSSENLCKDYESFSKLAHESGQPIYITKEGDGDLVIMSIEAFEQLTTQQNTKNNIDYPVDTNTSTNQIKGEKNMTENLLGRILKEMYSTASKGMQVTNIHTFAIFYADVIETERLNKKEILRVAGLPESYQTEISKGINLASYVQVKDSQIQRIEKIQELVKF